MRRTRSLLAALVLGAFAMITAQAQNRGVPQPQAYAALLEKARRGELREDFPEPALPNAERGTRNAERGTLSNSANGCEATARLSTRNLEGGTLRRRRSSVAGAGTELRFLGNDFAVLPNVNRRAMRARCLARNPPRAAQCFTHSRCKLAGSLGSVLFSHWFVASSCGVIPELS